MENQVIRFRPKTPYLEAHFLTEEEQETYDEVAKKFGNPTAQDNLRIWEGSNLFKILLLNQIGIRTATLADFDQIIQEQPDFFKRLYSDSPSVVLRSAGDTYERNDSIAKYLAKKVNLKEEPKVINGLKVVSDKNSYYGLAFRPGEDFNFFEAPELAHRNHGRKFTRQDERGMPIFDNNGTRTLYTRDSGLSGLYLGDDVDLVSGDAILSSSNGYGKVVVVSAEGASQKIKQKGNK